MAEVPYQPFPTQAPQLEAPDDVQHIEATPASFGAPVAEGLQKAGAGFMEAADFYNKVAADQATNGFLEGSRAIIYGDPSKGQAVGPDGQPLTSPDGSTAYNGGFYGLRGQDAMNAYPQAKEQLNELLAQQRSGLKTAAARLQFDTENRRYLNQALGEMGVHANQQQKVWADQVAGSKIAVTTNAIAADLGNPAALAQDREDLRNAFAKQDQVKFGLSPEITQGAVLKADQAYYTTQIRAALGNNDPDRAKAALDESGSILASSPDYDRLTAAVRSASFEKTSVTLSDQATQEALAQAAAQTKAGIGVGGGASVPPTHDAMLDAPDRNRATAASQTFQAKGWSAAQAAGITANLYAESGVSANPAGSNDGGKAYGAAQWHAERQAEFAKWAGHPIQNSTLQEQEAFVNYELTQGKFKAVGDQLRHATTPEQASEIMMRGFEVPKDQGPQAIANRQAIARQIAGGTFAPSQAPGAPAASTGATSSIADNLRMNMPQLMADFRAKAEAAMPNDPFHQEAAAQRFERSLKQVTEQQDQQYLADTHLVEANAVGATSWADIDAKGPTVAAARQRLQWEQPLLYDTWDRRFNANADGKAETFGTGFSGYLSRALAPTTDPNRITNPGQLNAFVGSGKDAALTNSGIQALSEITALRGTPQGEAFASQARTILGQMHGDLTFSSQPAGRFDPKGEERFSAFSAMALPIMVKAYRDGQLNQVMNPKSPDYIGNLAERFMRSPAEVIKDRLDLNSADRDLMKMEDNPSLGRDLLKRAVTAGNLSQQEAIRIGEDRGWFKRAEPSRHQASVAPGWKLGQPPPVSALPPLRP